MSDSPPQRRGPRGQAAETRAAILREARRSFAAVGYAGTRLRHVAQEAGVDVALVSYYVGSKENLFAAAMELPPSPRELVAEAVAGPVELLGESLTRQLLGAWADDASRSAAQGVLQSLSTRDDFGETVLAYGADHLLAPIAGALGVPDAGYRAALALSHLLGVALTRHVAVAPLRGMSDEQIVADVAPIIQHYLTGELSSSREASTRPPGATDGRRGPPERVPPARCSA